MAEKAINPLDEFEKYRLLLERRKKYHKLEYYKPYPFQIAFHNAMGFGTNFPAAQKILMAGNGCVSRETLIDHPDGTQSKAGDLFDAGMQFDVLSWDGYKIVPARVTAVIRKPAEQQYRAYTRNGKWFECTAKHRVLTSAGYVFFDNLRRSLPILQESNSERAQSVHGADAPSYSGTEKGCLDGCSVGFHQRDGRLLSGQENDQAFFPLRDGVLKQLCEWLRWDVVERRCMRILQRFCALLSSQGDALRSLGRFFLKIVPSYEYGARLRFRSNQSALQFQNYERRNDKDAQALQDQSEVFSLVDPYKEGNYIIGYSPVGVKDVFDFTVPYYENYLCAGLIQHNTGKTVCGGMDTAIHLTGKYPEWWKGMRFDHPIVCMVGGNTNEAARDICQKTLFGDPNEPQALGSGTIPVDLIGKRSSKPGVPNAFDTVLVKHVSGGWSKTMFRAYEQGPKKHMGHRIHLGWLDEEPPQDIWSQYLRATISTGGILSITFTPESGLTEVVNAFMNNLGRGQSLIKASWEDANHLVKDGKLTDEAVQLEAGFPAHEREMRRRGVPTYGTGLVFPFKQEQLEIDPFEIPRHWPRIIGIDFGWDHPFGAVMLTWDRDADVIYMIAEYRESRALPAIHAAAVKPWGNWPVAWPHDGLNTEKGTGDELVKSYTDEGLNMLPWKATNPPDPKQGQQEGDGGNSVEAAILEMFERMETGRFKVFKTCKYWFEEQRTYHRDEKMKLIKVRDDTLSASRYAVMMLRHARTEVVRVRRHVAMAGATNW